MFYTPLSVLHTFAYQLDPQHSGSYYETLPLEVESGHKTMLSSNNREPTIYIAACIDPGGTEVICLPHIFQPS